jgi:hypothetical protein
MNVLRPGTKVSLPQGEIVNALVNQVCIAANDHVTYQVVWWAGADHKEAWVHAHEVSAEIPEWIPIDFVVPNEGR